ncbi:hypothetical protein PV326_005992 [Microctonus aethiopoides]|nr:hypothetical protein PV326_005992 [Microctonus aethiopoides]
MSEMPVVSQIQHYQKSIEKCADNESRKLYRLPVTVQHLQETGVGRTVNALRKYDGTVGDAAKALVAKWKTMVVDEESSECDDEDETCIPDVPEGYSDNSESGMDKNTTNHHGSSRHRSHESHERNSQHSSRHDSSRHNSKQSSSTNSHSKSSVMQAVPESNINQSKNSKSSSDKSESKHNHDSKHDYRSEKKSKSSRDSKSDRHSSKKHEHHNSMNKSSKLDGLKGESSNKASSITGVNKEVNGNDAHRKRKREVSTNDKHTHKRRRNSTIGDSDDDDNDDDDDEDVDNDDDDDDDDDDEDDDHHHDNDNDENKFLPDASVESDIEYDARIKIKNEPTDSLMINDRASTSKDATKREKSSRDKHGNSSNKLKDDKHKHSSDKHKTKSESKSEHRRSEKRKDDTRNSTKSSTNSNSRSSKDHNDSSEKIKERKSSESKDKNTNQEHKDKKKKKSKYNGHDGIDCNSGTSFAEALGMCMAPVGNKKKVPLSPSLPVTKNIKVEPSTSSTLLSSSSLPSPTKAIKVKTETSLTKDDQPLSLLAPNVKLEPLSVDLASTLPEISPHYKPLPTNYMNPIHRRQEEDKALNEAIYAKNMRTKVYSGNKTSYTSVPSLYELCIRVLIENIEALEATGGVPYYIIKPVLERATADQLFMIEHYNPYLIEDTDDMWKFHCNREFRTKQREEMESWREMYMRCLDEREAKLKTLTANIKQSIDKSLPARSTKMAYVDNIVKPPRNVLRKQAKYGTSNTATSSSDLKKKILTGGNNAPTNISVPPPPGPRMKSSSSGVMKKNKAPLMAKALQLIKGRYKR